MAEASMVIHGAVCAPASLLDDADQKWIRSSEAYEPTFPAARLRSATGLPYPPGLGRRTSVGS